MNKSVTWIIIVVALVIIALLFFFRDNLTGTGGPAAVTESESQSNDIVLVNHITAGMPEQDVFVIDLKNTDKVVRVEGEKANESEVQSQTLFASAEEVPHDPFKLGENPLGPFPKGAELGFTMADWLAGTGSGIYRTTGETATITLRLENLIPDGVYTVWCSRIVLPPNPVITDSPCGNADGSENTVTADENGSASYEVVITPLTPSTPTEVSVIALAYHSDGTSHGASPGAFGLNSHVQLFWILPASTE